MVENALLVEANGHVIRRRLHAIVFALLVLSGAMSPEIAAGPGASSAMPAPGMARVWHLADGVYAPIGAIPVNSAFYCDFRAGTYRFTVERYGIPTDKPVEPQLTPGTETYREVQWLPTREEGYPGKTKSFFILGMSWQIARGWIAERRRNRSFVAPPSPQ